MKQQRSLQWQTQNTFIASGNGVGMHGSAVGSCGDGARQRLRQGVVHVHLVEGSVGDEGPLLGIFGHEHCIAPCD